LGESTSRPQQVLQHGDKAAPPPPPASSAAAAGMQETLSLQHQQQGLEMIAPALAVGLGARPADELQRRELAPSDAAIVPPVANEVATAGPSSKRQRMDASARDALVCEDQGGALDLPYPTLWPFHADAELPGADLADAELALLLPRCTG
jgi:hypothetical protein